MRGQHFRIKTPTLGILSQDGDRIPVTIPQGATVEVVDGPLDEKQLVDVKWEGKILMMFTIDLRKRGARLTASRRALTRCLAKKNLACLIFTKPR
jgi:hypothetical protein